MQIAPIHETDHTDFLALINAEIRPDRAKTNAWDDFPLILDPKNLAWSLGSYAPDGTLAGGIACLNTSLQTSCGVLQVAGIGSVVTKPEFRGQGISSALQIEMLAKLERKNVPLAVLWTDKPEIYAGRGFTSAGYEYHVDFTDATLSDSLSSGFQIASFNSGDCTQVENLYQEHPFHSIRKPGDSQILYQMPGTRGFVLKNPAGLVVAYAFCGKGGDFPDYVLEWGGEPGGVFSLLYEVRKRGLAHNVLVPAGTQAMAERLISLGAQWGAIPSGYWAVVNKVALAMFLGPDHPDSSPILDNPKQLLGTVSSEGFPVPGIIELAIWGFDSV